jgi:hypothetical protein
MDSKSLRDLDSVITALESQPGMKRIVGAMNVVFTRMAQEFYDRNQDFFPYKPTNKDLSKAFCVIKTKVSVKPIR